MTRAEQLIRKARFSKRYQGYQYLLQCVELPRLRIFLRAKMATSIFCSALNWSSMMTAACARCPSRYTSPWLRNTASPAGALDGISAQPGTTPGREDAKNSLKKSAVEPSMRPHLSGN